MKNHIRTTKKSAAPFFLIAAIMMILPVNVFAASFPDVAEKTVNYNAIEYLKQKGVISGYPDGTFQPDKKINRAEALKILLLASGTPVDSQIVLTFPDVSAGEWYYTYLQKAYELKIFEGYPDGMFKAGNNINVAESMKVILLTFKKIPPTALTNDPYPDVSKDVWYAAFADYCKTKQYIESLDDGKLHADREITRGEFTQLIYRLMYTEENNLDKFPLSTDWPVFTHPTGHYLMKHPFDWKVTPAGDSTVFWKQDEENGQLSFSRPYPNGATVTVVIDKNTEQTLFDDYLNDLPYFTNGITQRLTLNDYPFAAIAIDESRYNDYYFELPNKTITVLYTEAGLGLNNPQLLNEIRNMVGSVKYTEATSGITTKDQFLSQVRQKILVADAGDDVIGLFEELVLIETDSVGIGTGPVDYYYSAEYEVTLKLERDSNTLLALSDGKTTSF